MPIITCPNCGTKNRVDDRASSLQPVCGKCGASLPTNAATDLLGSNGHPIEVTDDSLPKVLESAGNKPVLVDCWAPWCPPCRMIAPIIDQLAVESQGNYVIGKLNTDENQRTAGQFRIEGIPTLLFFKNGQLVDRLVGAHPKQTIAERLRAHLQS